MLGNHSGHHNTEIKHELSKQMVIKTNRALFMLGNHSGHHNTEIKTFSPCGYIKHLHKKDLLASFDIFSEKGNV